MNHKSIRWLILCLTFIIFEAIARGQGQTVTVDDLYAQVLANFDKIQDMKMTVFIQELGMQNLRKRLPPGYDPNPYYDGDATDFYYMSPTLRMWKEDGVPYAVLTADKTIDRKFKDNSLREIPIRPQDFTINPSDPTFYRNMINYLKKYEVVQLVGNPKPNMYVIKAEPLPGYEHRDDQQGMYLEITIDYSRGVVEEMVFRSPSVDNKVTAIIDWQEHKEIQGIYWPQKLNKITNYYMENKPDHPLKDVSNVLFLMSNIEINTGTIKEEDFKV